MSIERPTGRTNLRREASAGDRVSGSWQHDKISVLVFKMAKFSVFGLNLVDFVS